MRRAEYGYKQIHKVCKSWSCIILTADTNIHQHETRCSAVQRREVAFTGRPLILHVTLPVRRPRVSDITLLENSHADLLSPSLSLCYEMREMRGSRFGGLMCTTTGKIGAIGNVEATVGG